jgi:tetratricopeptide (TPR) repeat protein/cold shock CspA family protein
VEVIETAYMTKGGEIMNQNEAFTIAEAKRKQGDFPGAYEKFREIWDTSGIPRSGCGCAHCLRKMGRCEEAALIAREVMEKYPKVTWALNELIWSLIQGDLKKARERGDLESVNAVAEEIFSLSNDDLSKRVTFFSVVDSFRHKMKWERVLQWCDKIDPEILPVEKPMAGPEHRGISERERYCYAKIRALMHLERWDDARNACKEAQTLFPKKSDFPRWAARALGETGDVDGALAEFNELLRRYRREWYIDAERAELLQRKGEQDAALTLACSAALGRGELKTKVNVLSLVANILHCQGDNEIASAHILLAKEVRQREKWAVPRELQDLELSVNKALKPQGHDISEFSGSFEQLREICREYWARHAEKASPSAVVHRAPQLATATIAAGAKVSGAGPQVPGPDKGKPRAAAAEAPSGRFSGKLLVLNKNFGFIKPDDGSDNVFVLVQDIPKDHRNAGTGVTYSLKSNFDHKKGKDSVRAVAVKAK